MNVNINAVVALLCVCIPYKFLLPYAPEADETVVYLKAVSIERERTILAPVKRVLSFISCTDPLIPGI